MYAAPGQLVDVGGHRLHLNCVGSGTPTVILESGLGETGAYWGWISTAVAHDTKVCVYDRAGRGWSDPASAPQDGVAVATDLHILLDRGHVSGSLCARRPFVGRAVRQDLRRPVSRTGRRNGLARRPTGRSVRAPSTFPSVLRWVPPHLGAASRRWLDSAWDDWSTTPTSATCLSEPATRSVSTTRRLVCSAACTTSSPSCRPSLAAGPLVSEPWRPTARRRDRCSGRSNGLAALAGRDGDDCRQTAATVSCPYTHDALITDQTAAQTSSQAIRDVVHAVRFATPLKTS